MPPLGAGDSGCGVRVWGGLGQRCPRGREGVPLGTGVPWLSAGRGWRWAEDLRGGCTVSELAGRTQTHGTNMRATDAFPCNPPVPAPCGK